LLVRPPDPDALARALTAAGIDYVPGPDSTFTVDMRDDLVTPDVVAHVALKQQIPLTELRRSDSGGLEQLFFFLTAGTADHPQEAAA
jgi:hypothetical protein